MTTQQDTSNWISWHGGDWCPLPLEPQDKVLVVLAKGGISGPHSAHYVEWCLVRQYCKVNP